jgi:putative oxidoreductase
MSTTATPAPVARPVATHRTARTRVLWALQAVLALQFAAGGLAKLAGAAAMVEMFAEIGAGQWFRYAIGALEVTGAVAVLVPRLSGLAALGLVGLMAGASATNVAVLGTGPWLPLVLLAVSAAVAYGRRDRTAALLTAGRDTITRITGRTR